MKKVLLGIAISLYVATMVSSCKNSEDNIKEAKSDVVVANKEVENANVALDKAISDSIDLFRKNEKEKLDANAKNIAAFKERIAKEKAENRAKYEKRLNELELKNTDMKKQLDDYKDNTKDKWDMFKTDFSHNMNELDNSFKDFFSRKN